MDSHYDLRDIARYGSGDTLREAIPHYDIEDIADLYDYSIEADNADTMAVLVDLDLVDPREMLEEAMRLESTNIVEYLQDYLFGDDVHQNMSIEEAILDNDLDYVKSLLLDGTVDIERVGELSALYGNKEILRYALKFGANDFPRMIDAAERGGNDDLAQYLEDIDDSLYYAMHK